MITEGKTAADRIVREFGTRNGAILFMGESEIVKRLRAAEPVRTSALGDREILEAAGSYIRSEFASLDDEGLPDESA